jgi:cyclopropane fatty-acyl-phospholipid synthase-like methyltransferase
VGLYDTRDDPWGHLTRVYERQKYARTLDALGSRRFVHGLEIGCGIGALSELLAPRCARLTSMDCIATALARARARLRAAPHVDLIEGAAPDDLPAIAPDLIVLSEVLYFMTEEEIVRLAAWLCGHATTDAQVLAVSWQGATGESLSGAAAVEHLARNMPCWTQRRTDREGYRIDRFVRAGR